MFELSFKVEYPDDLARVGTLVQMMLCPLTENNEPIVYLDSYCESADWFLSQSIYYLSALTRADFGRGDAEHLRTLSVQFDRLSKECSAAAEQARE